MDKYSEMIWQRGPVVEIMPEARKRFRETVETNPVAAHVALASVHHSLVKRYMVTRQQKLLVAWHGWRALFHARTADRLGLKNFHQADVVSSVLLRGFASDRRRALEIIKQALYSSAPSESAEMDPHTRALMLCNLGEMEYRTGTPKRAYERYAEARNLISSIEAEDSSDREQQLVRVLAKVGFFYYEHGSKPERYWATKLVGRAINLADSVAKDQAEKIRAEAHRCGYRLES